MNEEMISDIEINSAFLFTNFGGMKNNRDILKMGVLKAACGYSSGFTLYQIMLNFGLITGDLKKYRLTKKGKMFLWESFKMEGF